MINTGKDYVIEHFFDKTHLITNTIEKASALASSHKITLFFSPVSIFLEI